MGYDEPKSLGGREFGATLALPIWIDSMRVSLAGKPETQRTPPDGVSNAEGDWMYAEFLNGAGVKSVDLDVLPPTDADKPTTSGQTAN